MMKRIPGLILFFALSFSSPVVAQVFTTLYLPTAGTGLTLNVAAGRVFCAGSMATYSAGTLTMTASTTNYVYLSAASSCVPAVKTTAFTIGDIPIATVVAGSSSITTVTDNRTMFNQGGAIGVSSINGTTGAFTFSGTGVSCTGTTCTFSGSSSSGVQYNPSTTSIVFTGDSQIGDDTHVLGNLITVTAVNCNGTVCIMTNSGTNGLAAGDWITTDQITSPSFLSTPLTGFNIFTTGQTEFQVISTGLSTTQFEFAYTTNTGTGTGGTVENANYFLPYQAANLPFFKGHSNTQSRLPTGTPSIGALDSNFSTVIGTAPTSPAYLMLIGEANSIQLCYSAATIEASYQSVWTKAHAAGWTVVQSTLLPRSFNISVVGCPTAWTVFNTVNLWMRSQGQSMSNKSSGAYWDSLVDGYSLLSNYADSNLRTGSSWSAAAYGQYAALFNNAMATQGTLASFPLVNPVLITPTLGDAIASSITFPINAYATSDVALYLDKSGLTANSQQIEFAAWPYGAIHGYLKFQTDGLFHFSTDVSYGGISTSYIQGLATAPSGTCASSFSGLWALSQDGAITRCPSGGGTWSTFGGSSTATNLSGGAVGSVPYQSAASTTAFLASPTTSGHTFVPAWQPSGSAIAPVVLDLATYLGAPPAIGGTTPAAGAFSSLKDTGAAAGSGNYCLQVDTSGNVTNTGAACGSGGGGGTNVKLNSGSTLTVLGITGNIPETCSDTSGSGTAQSCSTADTFTPQSGNCVPYTTTTANSGTGLTVNINSLGARSVAVAGSSGWTTTLVANNSIPANKPMSLCYDGTNWNASGTGYVPSGGGSTGNTGWIFDDFIYDSAPGGYLGWNSTTTTGATVVRVTPAAGANGVTRVYGGTSSNSWATVYNASATGSSGVYYVGSGASVGVAGRVESSTTISGSGSSIDFVLGSNSSAPNPTNSIGFMCSYSTSVAGDWYSEVNASPVIDLGVACNTWHVLEIEVSGTTASLYIDGVLKDTQTATNATYRTNLTAWNHTASSTNVGLDVDWVGIKVPTITSVTLH